MIKIPVFNIPTLLRMSRSYYAVAIGRKPGIYATWNECKVQVDKFPASRFKKFQTEAAALNFIANKGNSNKQDNKNVSTAKKRSRSESDETIKRTPPKKTKILYSKAILIVPPSQQKESSSGFITDSDGYVNVYTDGACGGNGTAGAKAGIGVWFGENHPLNVSQAVVGKQTNNMAEILAVTIAARKAKEAGITKLKIITDSKFLIQCITTWMPKWKYNGWKTSENQPVKNKDELIEMEKALESLNILWEHVNGHSGIYGNEMADKLARAGCSNA
ncbi:ribonuclease H1 [Nomia melanderi]|uniref:ribonuclease H1 n=1 Tax=Nomia melanderi TaxID=2448451 RepID=UPI001303F474|nr:ribonuclease H1 [Nomia melanderi]XP_031848425.1 ribonuclease H1 [Nomia melanderi]XP_031848428.1 ribonuclease H1 [Nomia melanderi]XP_031848429.1 ribonuclease H1 [Nomia melanderi]XP_031848430.1 ribonuclease H1 [Nomia melanderi]XP_031848431.1 ribonuclease H1 [Nomia melanderi]